MERNWEREGGLPFSRHRPFFSRARALFSRAFQLLHVIPTV